MPGGDRRAGERKALREPGRLDQAGRRQLDPARRVAAKARQLAADQPRHAVVIPFVDDRVLEERPGAAAVGIPGGEEHSLAAADLPHGGAHLGQGRRGGASGEEPGHVAVGDDRRGAAGQVVRHRQDDEAAALDGIEVALAVAETAGGARPVGHDACGAVDQPHRSDHRGDLLTVGADVLNRRSPHGAGNPAQALHAAEAPLHRQRHEGIPVLAGRHPEARLGECLPAAGGQAEDDAGITGVRNEEIAAAAENEERQGVAQGDLHAARHVLLVPRFHEIQRAGPPTPKVV